MGLQILRPRIEHRHNPLTHQPPDARRRIRRQGTQPPQIIIHVRHQRPRHRLDKAIQTRQRLLPPPLRRTPQRPQQGRHHILKRRGRSVSRQAIRNILQQLPQGHQRPHGRRILRGRGALLVPGHDALQEKGQQLPPLLDGKGPQTLPQRHGGGATSRDGRAGRAPDGGFFVRDAAQQPVFDFRGRVGGEGHSPSVAREGSPQGVGGGVLRKGGRDQGVFEEEAGHLAEGVPHDRAGAAALSQVFVRRGGGSSVAGGDHFGDPAAAALEHLAVRIVETLQFGEGDVLGGGTAEDAAEVAAEVAVAFRGGGQGVVAGLEGEGVAGVVGGVGVGEGGEEGEDLAVGWGRWRWEFYCHGGCSLVGCDRCGIVVGTGLA
mmetsp:Transcript_27121/g.54787  ORF Transcript_27121/g.54787 Transcript_27121/m.54787 type:complete len:375 (+) Transcript_27121:1270-2394(+)